MKGLADIQKAAEALPPEQKQELILFLATRLRAAGARAPEPRTFTRQEIEAWISEDEADMDRFKREG